MDEIRRIYSRYIKASSEERTRSERAQDVTIAPDAFDVESKDRVDVKSLHPEKLKRGWMKR